MSRKFKIVIAGAKWTKWKEEYRLVVFGESIAHVFKIQGKWRAWFSGANDSIRCINRGGFETASAAKRYVVEQLGKVAK